MNSGVSARDIATKSETVWLGLAGLCSGFDGKEVLLVSPTDPGS